MKKFFFIIVALFLISGAGIPQPAEAQYDGKAEWVVDQSNILSTQTRYRLMDNAMKHEKNTSDQLVTLIIDSLNGQNLEQYSLRMANKWGTGQKTKNNGVLLLVVTKDRRVRIEVGRGLEGVLTDQIAKSIIDNEMIPHFREARMEQGVAAGHKAILEALGGTYKTTSPFENLLFYIFIIPYLWLRSKMGGGFSGGGGGFGGGGASGSW